MNNFPIGSDYCNTNCQLSCQCIVQNNQSNEPIKSTACIVNCQEEFEHKELEVCSVSCEANPQDCICQTGCLSTCLSNVQSCISGQSNGTKCITYNENQNVKLSEVEGGL